MFLRFLLFSSLLSGVLGTILLSSAPVSWPDPAPALESFDFITCGHFIDEIKEPYSWKSDTYATYGLFAGDRNDIKMNPVRIFGTRPRKLAAKFSDEAGRKAKEFFNIVNEVLVAGSADSNELRRAVVGEAAELFCQQNWRFFEHLSPFFVQEGVPIILEDQARKLFLAGLAAVLEWRYNKIVWVVSDDVDLLAQQTLVEYVASARQLFPGIFSAADGGENAPVSEAVKKAYQYHKSDWDFHHSFKLLVAESKTSFNIQPGFVPASTDVVPVMEVSPSLNLVNLDDLEQRRMAGRFCLHYTRARQLEPLLTSEITALSSLLLHPKLKEKNFRLQGETFDQSESHDHSALQPGMKSALSTVGILIDGEHQEYGAVGYPEDLRTINGVSGRAAEEVLDYGLSKLPKKLLQRFEDSKGNIYPVVLKSKADSRKQITPLPTWYQSVGEWSHLSETVATINQ